MTAATAAGPALRLAAAGLPRRANRLAEQITGRPYLSHSQVSCMQTCPMRFDFQYVKRVPRAFIPTSLIFGSGLHASLELWYRARLEGLGVAHEALLSAYHEGWRRQQEEHGHVPVRFNKGQTGDSLHALADRMLKAFTVSPLARPKGTILAVEEELRIMVDPELPDVLARIDLLTYSDAYLHAIDFKTARSRWRDEQADEAAGQLLLYALTVQRMSLALGLPVKLHFAVITKHVKPRVQLLEVPVDRGRLEAMKRSVAATWDAIQGGRFYPNPSPKNCATCPFRNRCPIFGGR